MSCTAGLAGAVTTPHAWQKLASLSFGYKQEPQRRAGFPGRKTWKENRENLETESCVMTKRAQSEKGKAERFRRLSCRARDDRLQQPEGEPTKTVLDASRELPG